MIWTDPQGLRWRRCIPAAADDAEAAFGAPAGPPDLETLAMERGWPPEFTRRLHEQLEARGLYEARDLRRLGTAALTSAVTAAARSDAQAVSQLYAD